LPNLGYDDALSHALHSRPQPVLQRTGDPAPTASCPSLAHPLRDDEQGLRVLRDDTTR